MRPVEFSPESIITAGRDLQAAGRNITGFALRQKVGGGNPSRLKQVWDEHLASQSVTKAEPVAELPVEVAEEVALVTKELTQRLGALAVELNDKAVKAAERRVHEVVRSAGGQRTQAERELADAAATVDDLEAKLDEAAEQTETLQGKVASLQEINQAQAVELARVNAAVEAERERHKQEVDQLRGELAAQKEVNQALSVERDQVRQETRVAREDAANLRGQIEAMKTQVGELMQVLATKKS
jgi:chromosome segregation ATPase